MNRFGRRSSTAAQRAAAFSLSWGYRPGGNLHTLSSREATGVLDSTGARLAGQPRRVGADSPVETDKTFNHETRPHFDNETLITTVTSAAAVARPFDEIINLLDPRAWAARTELWTDSYVVAHDSRKRVLFDRDGRPEEHATLNDPRKWGTEFSGVLFEVTDWNVHEETVSRFEVLLNIEYGTRDDPQRKLLLGYGPEEKPMPNGRSFLHTYSLHQGISGQLGYNIVDGGVEVDSGYAYAVECEWRGEIVTRVEVQKAVRYVDFTPGEGDDGPFDRGQLFNYLAPGTIGVWIGSLVGDGLNASL